MAQIIINTTAEQDARVSPAFGSILGLGRNATADEVKGAIIQWVRGQVQDYERRVNMQTFVPAPLDPT